MPDRVNLDLVEDRLIKATSPRASKAELIDCVAVVTDLISEVRYLRIKARQFDRLMERHTLVQAAPNTTVSRGLGMAGG